MPSIVVKAFGGMRQIVDPRLLNPSEAQIAQNVRLISGAIEPLNNSTTLQALTVSNPSTIWRFGYSAVETEWWLEFAAATDVIRSPIAADPWNRTYWTDGSTAKYAPSSLLLSGGGPFPGASYTLGVPAPTVAPSVSGTAGSGSTAETRSYVYTYVSAYGEEGPPSPPSAPTAFDPAFAVALSGMSTGPSGAYNITLKRIYRTSVVGASAQFQFVAEIPVANTTYSDTIAQASLGEVLATTDWMPPPSGLKGLRLLANGAAIGFVGNTVHLTEPNLPHAWAHSVTIEEQIVGIGVFRQGAAILTTGHPYILTGADPASMTPERLERPLPCLSRRSVVDMGDGCIYASSEGLVSVGPGGAEIITKRLISQDAWRQLDPSSMAAATIEGRYYATYTTLAGARQILILDFEGSGAALTVSDFNSATQVTAMYADPVSSTLYMAKGGSIVRFDRGTTKLTGSWLSGIYKLSTPANMACACVDASAYPVTLKIFVDGSLFFTKTVTNSNAFRLPAGFEASEWGFQVDTQYTVTRVAMATSISELKSLQ